LLLLVTHFGDQALAILVAHGFVGHGLLLQENGLTLLEV
jgi:hypothetical protein